MSIEMKEFVTLIALGVIYIGALLVYNKTGKNKGAE